MFAVKILPQTTVTYACIQSICAEIFLLPGSHLKKKIDLKIFPKSQSDRLDKSNEYNFGTWLPKQRETVCLFRHEGMTLVYVISQKQFYRGNPDVLLSSECPDGTVFLAHFTFDEETSDEDVKSGRRVHRVLIFDILFINHKTLDGMDPIERYSYLQKLHNVFCSPVCIVQWVGDCKNLTDELKSKKFKIPHAIEGVIKLTRNTSHIMTHINMNA